MASDSSVLIGTYGATEIGVVFGAVLLGVQTLQTLNYFRLFSKDSLLLKATVSLSLFLELGESTCGLHALYAITVTLYGKPPSEILANPPHSYVLRNVFLTVSNTVAQVLQVWTSTSAVTSVEMELRGVKIAAMFVTPILDIFIASSLCFYLYRFRERSVKRTHQILDTLTLWTIETTLLTSVCAVTQAVLFTVRSDLWYMVLASIQSKLFSNSMLAVLNGRARFRSQDEVPGISEVLVFDLSERRNDGTINSVFSSPISRHSHSAREQKETLQLRLP
ncbi:hypothetical protein C8J57DRAFT_1273055 [Mycena rebaudengoi]|nr:hypothetical protein C8J57DRAFT_1273055 [Mycena rebaudengoi]